MQLFFKSANCNLIKKLYKNKNFVKIQNFQKQNSIYLNRESNICKVYKNSEYSKKIVYCFERVAQKSKNLLISTNNLKNIQVCKSIPSDKNFELSNNVENSNFRKISKIGISNVNVSEYLSENGKYEKNLFTPFNKSKKSQVQKQNSRFFENSKQQVVSITYEEIGLFPRSFNRVFDRFFKQLFFDVENLVIQEYRFYRYLFLTTVKCLFILIFVPFGINFLAKNYVIGPVTEYYWNTHNHEIFLNSYQQKRAFSELKNFEEKIYFESLLLSETQLSETVDSYTLENQKTLQLFGENSLEFSPNNNFVSKISNTDMNLTKIQQFNTSKNIEFVKNGQNRNFQYFNSSDTPMVLDLHEQFIWNSNNIQINQSKMNQESLVNNKKFEQSSNPLNSYLFKSSKKR